MLKKRQQPNRRKKVQTQSDPLSNLPRDDELFGSTMDSQPAYGDIFASLLDFASEPDSSNAGPSGKGAPGDPNAKLDWKRLVTHIRELSYVQKALLAAIVIVVTALSYVLLHHAPSAPQTRPAEEPVDIVEEPLSTLPEPAQSASQSAPARTASDVPAPESLSLQAADQLYLARDFENALITYDRLFRRFPPSEDYQPLRDFLLFRMAMCCRNAGDAVQAESLFRTVSLSRLATLRALAKYHQSLMLIGQSRFLEAAMKAYQTLALIEVVDYDKNWVRAVQQQCRFLIAESFTRQIREFTETLTALKAA